MVIVEYVLLIWKTSMDFVENVERTVLSVEMATVRYVKQDLLLMRRVNVFKRHVKYGTQIVMIVTSMGV
jgi:hypothetical protein